MRHRFRRPPARGSCRWPRSAPRPAIPTRSRQRTPAKNGGSVDFGVQDTRSYDESPPKNRPVGLLSFCPELYWSEPGAVNRKPAQTTTRSRGAFKKLVVECGGVATGFRDL